MNDNTLDFVTLFLVVAFIIASLLGLILLIFMAVAHPILGSILLGFFGLSLTITSGITLYGNYKKNKRD